MPEVYNWQLGRKMLYPYEERHPKWQFAFVFNINRCLACQTCSMADKSTWLFSKGQEYMWWNNVETKPYGGYPHHWDVKTLDLLDKANPGGQKWNGTPRDLKAPGKPSLAAMPSGSFENIVPTTLLVGTESHMFMNTSAMVSNPQKK